ncbi:MAG TPA: hypothetical protein VEY11_16090 [Pyrinomonadaceae bacterium]|nr:hypothetical protein [Pyrinomonadaceae bacterium]
MKTRLRTRFLRALRFTFAGLALVVIIIAFNPRQSAAQQTDGERDAPRFEDYAAAVSREPVAPLDLDSHPLARKYRTMLRQGRREEGVNFAGHYTLASAGCGTGCSIGAITDTRTGRVYFPKELHGWTSIVGDYDPPEGEDLWTFRPHSRLLRGLGRPNIGGAGEERHGASGIYYYEWTGSRLRLVKFTHVGSYPVADPPTRRNRHGRRGRR